MGTVRPLCRNNPLSPFLVALMALMLLIGGNTVLFNMLPSDDVHMIPHSPLLQHFNDTFPRRSIVSASPTLASTKNPQLESAKIQSYQRIGDANHTMEVLQMMGVKWSELEEHKRDIPLWSQVLDNYGGGDEAVILGLEQCDTYRKTTPVQEIALGPAGLFSTGTNLLYQLIKANCQGPDQSRYGRQRPLKFSLMQVPWGKHNPEEARGVFVVNTMKRYVENPLSVLPVVSIRHPYSWMSAMCKHSYGTRWPHHPEQCDRTLHLEGRIKEVPYGYKNNGTHSVKTTYQSLAHMYMEWYKPYFEQRAYPRLMIRFEDLVFRSKDVVTKVCECVGGTMNGWRGQFIYKTKSSNKGPGHGQRSDLLSAFIKYGQPLDYFYGQYTGLDRLIMSQAFRNPDHSKGEIFETLKYPLLG